MMTLITQTKKLRVLPLTAALIASAACSTDDAAPKNAGANGRAVFENAADMTLAPAEVAAEQGEQAEQGEAALDFDTFVFDGAGVEGAAAGSASQRRWPKSAITSPNAGTVTGLVFDAATGQPINTGTVSTAAACVGRGCGPGQRTRLLRPVTSVNIRGGAFQFDAQTRQLTLTPTTTFRVSAPGYTAVRVAHGPWAAANGGTPLPPIYLCRVGSRSSDRDGICDAAEARYGTDPAQTDSDGDGFSDSAELYGVYNREVLDIRGLGVDPRQIDVLLEIDYQPTRAPTEAGLQAVKDAFANAPPRPEWPNNKPGIALHTWIDDQVDNDRPVDYPDLVDATATVKNWWNLNSSWPTHYGLFAGSLSFNGEVISNSGVSSSIPGQIFFVTLHESPNTGGAVTEAEQARTLMHELGHNLGLQHGGQEPTKYKPNYFSVMNYMYQFDALPSPEPEEDGNEDVMLMDYQNFETPALDETALDEPLGMQASVSTEGPLIGRPWYCYLSDGVADNSERECLCFSRFKIGGVPGEIDFDGDGQISAMPVKADLDGYLDATNIIQATPNDWLILDFSGKPNPNIRVVDQRTLLCPPPPDELPEIVQRTVAEDGTMVEKKCSDLKPPATGRFAADGGVEDAALPDDAAVEDAAIDAAPSADTPLTDAGLTGMADDTQSEGSESEGSAAEDPWGTGARDEGDNPLPQGEEPMQGDEPPPEDAGVWEEFVPFGIW